MRVGALGIVLLVSGFATSAFAADRVIQNGIDTFATPADGSTYIDFAKTPIPAGFFCPASEPFTGRVALRGEPVVTGTPGAFGATDTIVQRLDDAVFNKRGVAVTRVQFRALSLKSITPIETECGQFTATASLDGVQPITRMVITRENENGGRFSAPLSLNVKMSFQPVGRVSGEVLEIPVTVRFPGSLRVPWRSRTVAPRPAGFVLVDTDGDRVADTYLPGTSNFIAGQPSPLASREAIEKGRVCHENDGCKHCYDECNFNCPIEP